MYKIDRRGGPGRGSKIVLYDEPDVFVMLINLLVAWYSIECIAQLLCFIFNGLFKSYFSPNNRVPQLNESYCICLLAWEPSFAWCNPYKSPIQELELPIYAHFRGSSEYHNQTQLSGEGVHEFWSNINTKRDYYLIYIYIWTVLP